MPRRQNEKEKTKEQTIQYALGEIKNGAYSSVYSAAKSLSIPPTTLRYRKQGRLTRSMARIDQQCLSDAEKQALAK